MTLNNLMDHEISKEERVKHFDFNHLTSVIFGVKTSDQDKMKIVNLIADKCKKYQRPNFKFYQAHFSSHSDKMEIVKLKLFDIAGKI